MVMVRVRPRNRVEALRWASQAETGSVPTAAEGFADFVEPASRSHRYGYAMGVESNTTLAEAGPFRGAASIIVEFQNLALTFVCLHHYGAGMGLS